jgi:hypothetical protein
MPDSSLLILEKASSKLHGFLDEVVFVGGAVLGLLITDEGSAPARPTVDVDVIAEISTFTEYFDFSQRHIASGFREDDGELPLNCRWLSAGLILDVMPTADGVLGPVNRWYKEALESADVHSLSNGDRIRVISAECFLGTKMEAFRARGNHDYLSSRDLEDVVAVIDGRKSIVYEISSSSEELREYLSQAAQELLTEPRFLDVLPGYFLPDSISQQRLPELLRKLKAISRQ